MGARKLFFEGLCTLRLALAIIVTGIMFVSLVPLAEAASQDVLPASTLPSQGQFPNQAGASGIAGAQWSICVNGVLTLEEGFIHWTASQSPWHAYRDGINRIVIAGQVTTGTSLRSLFEDLSLVTTIEGTQHFDTSNLRDMRHLFSGMSSLTSLDVSSWNTSNATDMRNLFSGASSLTSLNLSTWNTDRVTRMDNAFMGTSSLVSLNVSTWNTSNVVDMRSLFRDASSLTSLDISAWNTGRVTRMDSMFRNATSLTSLDISAWNTSSVTHMDSMFRHDDRQNVGSLTSLDLSGWDTSNVLYMNSMFRYARNLANLDISSWNAGSVRQMNAMFHYAESVTRLDLSAWNTSNSLTRVDDMFRNANSLEYVNLSGWDTSNVTRMERLFRSSDSLTTVNLGNWDSRSVISMHEMFIGVNTLEVLTLGENFSFHLDVRLRSLYRCDVFTGSWQNVGTGTLTNPQGEHALRSAALVKYYDGSTMADTFVWQRWDSTGAPLPCLERRDRSNDGNALGVFWWSTIPIDLYYLEWAADQGATEIWLTNARLSSDTFGGNDRLREFIRAAYERDIEVYLLSGRWRWIHPAMGYEQDFHRMMASFLDYQDTAAENERFSGVSLNVEPHGHPEWTGSPPPEVRRYHQQRFLDFVVRVTDMYGPMDWTGNSNRPDLVDHRGTIRPVYQALIHEADRVILMAYRDRYHRLYERSSHYIVYAQSIDRVMIIAVNTNPDARPSTTFWRHGLSYMYYAFERLHNLVRDLHDYHQLGIGIQSIRTWYTMPDYSLCSCENLCPGICENCLDCNICECMPGSGCECETCWICGYCIYCDEDCIDCTLCTCCPCDNFCPEGCGKCLDCEGCACQSACPCENICPGECENCLDCGVCTCPSISPMGLIVENTVSPLALSALIFAIPFVMRHTRNNVISGIRSRLRCS